MMNTIKFRVAAKTDVGVVRTNNEDNFQVASDLSSGQMRWVNNEVLSLNELGTLLVVADGMGGMNAGEVASDLAISTVCDLFSPKYLTSEVRLNRYSIEKYMNEAIIAADQRIKQAAKDHPENRGMGTTIVLAWLLDGKLYVSWCGDSRAYVYNPKLGLRPITKDHSYVQNLVDRGAISQEDAFDFPDSNIITRSLSDSRGQAEPESLIRPYEVCDGDIILLCTDGLCGMLRDRDIEAVIRNNEDDMGTLVDELIHSACEADGLDNITICLCQILNGGKLFDPERLMEYNKCSDLSSNGYNDEVHKEVKGKFYEHKNWLVIAIALILLIGLITGSIIGWRKSNGRKSTNESYSLKLDSMNRDSIETVLPISVTDGKSNVKAQKTNSEQVVKDSDKTTLDRKNGNRKSVEKQAGIKKDNIQESKINESEEGVTDTTDFINLVGNIKDSVLFQISQDSILSEVKDEVTDVNLIIGTYEE